MEYVQYIASGNIEMGNYYFFRKQGKRNDKEKNIGYRWRRVSWFTLM